MCHPGASWKCNPSQRSPGNAVGVAAINSTTACAVVAAPLSSFQKQVLTDKYFCDGITAGDLNRDGKMDIVAGPFWYEGPDFKLKL